MSIIANRNAANKKEERDALLSRESIQLFGDKPHLEGDNFRGTLCLNVQQKLASIAVPWGIEIVEFALSDIGFQDKAVEHSLANATAQTRQAEAQFALQRAQNATALVKANADAQQTLIKQRNDAEKRQIDTTSKTDSLLLEAKAESEAAFLRAKRAAEAKVEALKIEADGVEYQAIAQMKAAKARAEGEIALSQAKLVPLKDPGFLQLEMMKLEVDRAAHLSHIQSPAVVFSGDSSSNATGSLFFGQGTNLMQLAMQQKALAMESAFKDKTSNEKKSNERPPRAIDK